MQPALEPLLTLLRDAGALVRTLQQQITLNIKQDGSVVTEADLESHALICKTLARLTPDIPIVSEEQPLEQSEKILRETNTFWAVDPLDVTANYAGGGNSYSINIALIENGIPTWGGLYFPGLDELYYTDQGKAFKQTAKEPARPIHVAPLTTGVVMPQEKEKTLKVMFTRGQRRACLVATGEATFSSERAGFRIWDMAATYAIVHAAGGKICHPGGEALRFDIIEFPAYVVAHAELMAHLCPGSEASEGKRKNA